MARYFALTLISLSMLAAQPALRPPQMGFASVSDGTLRPVYGVAGNFVLGPSVATTVLSQAFSGSLGLLKTDTTLKAFDAQGHVLGTSDAAPGPALFAFSPDGVTALAYIATSNTLMEWSRNSFATVPIRPETSAYDLVIAIAFPNAFEASLIVQRNTAIWQVQLPFTRAKVVSQKPLAGVTAPVLALSSGDLVFTNAQGLMLRHPDGSDVHIPGPLPSNFSLQQMGAEWVQLSDLESSRRFAIRIATGREAFYQLPEAGQ